MVGIIITIILDIATFTIIISINIITIIINNIIMFLLRLLSSYLWLRCLHAKDLDNFCWQAFMRETYKTVPKLGRSVRTAKHSDIQIHQGAT